MKSKILFLMLLAGGMAAWGAMPTLTLEECVAVAVDNNPALKAERAKVDVAQARTGTYLDLPNTGIELSQSTIEGAGLDNGLTFSQEFDFPTIYVARRNVRKAEVQVAREEYNDEYLKLKGEIYSVYYSLMYAKAKAGAVRRDMEAYTEFSRISAARYEAGETSRLEFLNADRMKVKMETLLSDAELSVVTLQSRLGALLGEPEGVDIPEEEISVIPYHGDMLQFDPSSTSSSRIMQANIEVNERNLSLVRQEFLPSFSVSATSQLVLKGFNPYHVERERFRKGDFMGFSVGITVPLFFGGKRAQMLTAKRETELARLRHADELARMNADFITLKNELMLLDKRLGYYRGEALERAAEMKRLARVSYELGEIDYLEYMQNIEAALEIWMEYLETAEKYNQSIIRIQTIQGEI